ncbi:DsrE family protein [Neptuniibacter sp.]|uniref:DsrE family protein n=1 Tax=Neptuniibacter sp. TaxID=1962643 RepID=UPI00262D36D3|nr:DsrE family protein [Neptuniibacter sp.]MCP4596815.1 hypothetical protein [Neptuniibacter sp.]
MYLKARSIFLSILLACLVIPTVSAAEYQPQKVVYHINYDDPKRISATFANMTNHIGELGEDNIEIKAVVHGPAIKYFMEATEDEAKQTTLDSLRLNDVQFIICGNSLDGFKVTKEDLYEVEEEDVVKAGLPEIVHLQQQGYFYVRP